MHWTGVGEMIPNSTRTGGRSCRFVYVPSLCFGLCVFGTDLRRRTNEEAVQRVNKYFTRMPCPLKESSNGTHGPEGKGSSTLIRISGRARIALPKLLPPPSTHWCRRIIYYSFSAEQFFPLPLSRSEKGEKKMQSKNGRAVFDLLPSSLGKFSNALFTHKFTEIQAFFTFTSSRLPSRTRGHYFYKQSHRIQRTILQFSQEF